MRKEVLILIAIVFSYLLVAELPLFALKFKNFKWNDNKVRYLFLICCVILFLLFQVLALPLIISLYIFINLMLKLFSEREV
jgi:CDP-diacylglycerol--serine O-phosphatidyltransferase